MILPIWPSAILPHEPLNDSYAQKLPDKLIRTDFEQGVPRQRRRFRSALSTFQVTWPMSPAQKFIFDGWIENAIASGEGWFQILVFTNSDYVNVDARFAKGSLSVTRSGGEWIVSAQLEVKNYPAPTGVDTAAAMLTYGSALSLTNTVALFHDIVHIQYPAAVTGP